MTGAAKGMAGLIAALALIGGLAFWLLKDDGGGIGSGGRKTAANAFDAAARPDAAASTADGAKRAAEEKPVAAEAAESSEGKLPPGTPTAEFLAGTVVDMEGRPVVNAEVTFAPSTLGPRMRGRGGNRVRTPFFQQNTPEIPPTSIKTGADGTFRLAHVARLDNFDLTVDHPDYLYVRRSGVVVPARGMDVGRITLDAGGAVSGQVTGPGGVKVANAEVWLEDPQDDNNPFRFFAFGQPARGERKTVTDEQGHFRLTGMPAGKCVAAAKSDAYPEASSPALDVKLADEVSNVVVNLEAGDRLAGTVKGPDGKAVADAEIHVNQNNRGMSFSFGGRRMPFEPATKTDADGRFEVKALKRGTYEVAVVAKNFAVKTVPDVDSSAGAPLDVTLAAGTHVAGMVRLKDTQEPAKNVKVQLQRVWGENNVMPTSLDFPPDSDNVATQDGAFVIPEVDPGTYRIVGRGDDTTRATSANFEVVEGQNVENVEVAVERGAVVEGRVTDAATGAPVAGVDVEASTTPQDNPVSSTPGGRSVTVQTVIGGGGRRFFGGNGSRQAVARAKTDAEGRYELKSISAGSIQIETRHADYATARSAPLELKAGEHKSGYDVALGRGGAVEGAVVGLDGKPRAGDRIDVTSKTVDGVALHAVSDGDGLYHVDHVPVGDGIVERSEADGGDGRRGAAVFRAVVAADGTDQEPGKPFSVKEGETARVDFTQQEKPYVEGVVRSASGPVAGVTVTASAAGGGRRGTFFLGGGGGKTATTAADGSYRITDLEPGSYRISARHPESIVPVREQVELKSGEPGRVDFFLEGGVIEGDVFAQKNHAKLEGAVVTLAKIDKPDAASQGGTADVSIAFAVDTPRRGRGGRGFQSFRLGEDGGTTQVLSDESGHFRVPWVPAGTWKVSVAHPGFLEAQSQEVALAANGHVEGVKLEMPVAAQLIVHLKSKGTGQPLPNAPVELATDDGGHEFGVTDQDGAAHFESLKPGTWTVTGRKNFGNNNANDGQKKTVEAPADRTTEITIDV